MARTWQDLNAAEVITVEELEAVDNNSMIHKDNNWNYQAIAIWAAWTVPTSNWPTSDPTFQATAAWWHTIQDEWTPLTDRANLNFTWTWVTVTDDSGNDATVVDIWAALSPAYTVTNVTPDRSYDADNTNLNEIADVLGTVIDDMSTFGAVGWPVAISNWGTGQTTQQAAIDALTDVSSATTAQVFTKDGSGNATFQDVAWGGFSATSVFSTDFTAASRQNSFSDWGSSITYGTNGMVFNTSATATSSSVAKTWLSQQDLFSWESKYSINVDVAAMWTSATSYFWVWSVTVSGTWHTYTTDHFWFKIINNAGSIDLSATQWDGTTESATLLTAWLTISEWLELIAIRNTSSIDYYFRIKWWTLSSVVTISTNIPNTWIWSFQCSASNNSVAATTVFNIWWFTYER